MAKQIRHQHLHGTAARWTSVNPVLAVGESGYESDTGKSKIGDGVTAWTALPYLGTIIGTTGTNDEYIIVADGVGGKIIKAVAQNALKLDDFGTPDDNTDLDATDDHHGLLPKLTNSLSDYLRADGTWFEPPYVGTTVFNVEKHGADKTGASDSTAAIQAAIGACELQGGGVVFFPKGLYIISDTLTITEPVSLVGEGSDRTDFEIGSFTDYSTIPDGDWHERIYDKYPFDPTRSISLIRWSNEFNTTPARGTMVRVMKTGTGAAAGAHFAIGGMHWRDLAFDSLVLGGSSSPPFDIATGPAYCLDFDLVQKSTFSNIKIACITGTAIRMYPRYNRSGVGTANIIAQNCVFNLFENIHISQVCRGILMDGTIAGTLDPITGLWDQATWSYGGNCCNNSFIGISIRYGDGAPFGINDGSHKLGTSLYNLCAYDGWFGKATSASSSSLTDTSANWDTANNWLKGCIVYVRGGTGQGSWGKITSNTATTLTCSGGWFKSDGTAGTSPENGDQYVIDTGTYAIKCNLSDTNTFYRVWTEGSNIVGGVPVHDIIFAGGNATHHNGFFGVYGTVRAMNGTFNEMFDYQMNQGTPQQPSVENVTEMYYDQPWTTFTPVLVWYDAGGVMTGGLHATPTVSFRYRMDHGTIHFDAHIYGADGSDATNLVFTLPRPAFPQVDAEPLRIIPVIAWSQIVTTFYPLCAGIVASSTNGNVNFFNFQKLSDGTAFRIQVSGTFEVQ